MTQHEIPEGFKLLRKRPRSDADPAEIRNQQYAISEKGVLLDLTTGLTHIPAEGESSVTIKKEGPGWQIESEFDMPILVARYFGGREEGLKQEDFDELVALSGLSPEICRERLDSGWAYEVTDGEDGKWIKAEDR